MWEEIKTSLKESLSSAGYQTLLSTATIDYQDNVLTIEVPNLFSKEWIKDGGTHYCRKMPEVVVYDLVVNRSKKKMKKKTNN